MLFWKSHRWLFFLFPWNLDRLNALSRFLTTKVTNWPFEQDPGIRWSISLTLGWLSFTDCRLNSSVGYQPQEKHPDLPGESGGCMAWSVCPGQLRVVHQGLCYFCLAPPDFWGCQWHEWKQKHIFWHNEDQSKVVRKLELPRPWGEIEKFSAFRYWAFVIQASSAVNNGFVHLPISN